MSENKVDTKGKETLVNRARQFLTEVFKDAKSTNKFQCNLCLKVINGKSPSNLVTHFKNSHEKEYCEKIANKTEDSIPVRRLKTVFSCVELVAINNYPFSVLSSSGFRHALEDKLREFQLAGCSLNLSDHHVYEIKEKVREVATEIKSLIKSEVKQKVISVMIDSATRNGRSIFGVNIQYKHNGELKVVTLAMRELKKSHTAVYLSKILHEILAEYDIDLSQVLTITTDNGSNMLATVKEIESKLFESFESSGDIVTSQNVPISHVGEMEISQLRIIEPNYDDDGLIEEDIEELLKESEFNENDAYDLLFDESTVYGDLIDKLVFDIRKETGNHHLFVTSIKCAAHTLQLAVRDAINMLKKEEQNDASLCRVAAKFLCL